MVVELVCTIFRCCRIAARVFSHEILHRRRDGAFELDRGRSTLKFRLPVLLGVLAAQPAAAAGTAFQLVGRGVQIYTCWQAEEGFAWRLKAPDAVLYETSGAVAGRHYAGPSWQGTDGSSVTGQVVQASPAAQAGSVPWVVLRAAANGGAGRFSDVGYIVRSQTEGGAAPIAGCDAGHTGAEIRVRYQATYLFFPAPAAK